MTREDLVQALEHACGNITHAAVLIERSKVHAMRLVARHKLREYALELRLLAGGKATGRPSNGNINA